MSTLSDAEMDAIGDGWSEIYRAQDEAEAERLGAWVCPVDRTMVPLGENCSECGCHPSTCECPDCEQDEEELEYMPLWATIDALSDEWADEHERDDSEGWDDES